MLVVVFLLGEDAKVYIVVALEEESSTERVIYVCVIIFMCVGVRSMCNV